MGWLSRSGLARLLGRYPQFKRAVRGVYLLIQRVAILYRLRGHGGFPDPGVIDVELADIKLRILDDFDKLGARARILGGDWDRQGVHPLETLEVLHAFEERYQKGVAWRDTEFYRRVQSEIEFGKVKWGCKNNSDLDQRFRELDRLYRDIADNGYKSQRLLSDKKGTAFELYDEVSVCINRYGDFLFSDGRHRFCIATQLGLKSIPVQVSYRHKQWQIFRERVFAYADQNGGLVYAPLLHPDLAHVPSLHGHERFEMIRQSLPVLGGTVLDIGAHWGYFSHMFERAGFVCYAVESSEHYLYFLEGLRRACGRTFTVIKRSVFEPMDMLSFDVVLALNIFHHFLKTEEQYRQLVALLRRLDMQVMYFESHKPTEGQMSDSYINYPPEEFVAFILENSCLNTSRFLGVAEDGRFLYMLSR